MKVDISYHYDENDHLDTSVDVEIDDEDLWSLDSTLAEIISPALKAFRDSEPMGWPARPLEDDPHGRPDPDATPGSYEEWLEMIDEMIWAMEQVKIGRMPREWIEDGLPPRNEMIAYHDRVQNGLELFGKYFCALWD
jgi:hypothetical protein